MRPDAEKVLRSWDEEAATTLQVIRALPPGSLGFRPHERGMDAGTLAWHIVTSERWFCTGWMGVEAPGEDPVPKDAPPGSPGEMAAARERSHAALAAAVRERGEDWLEGEVEAYGMRERRIDILHLLLRHEAHHRGQLTILLRLAGGRIPPVYGPTADEGGDP